MQRSGLDAFFYFLYSLYILRSLRSPWSESETTNESSGEVAENVPIEVWHDEYIVLVGVESHVQAHLFKQLIFEFDVWVPLGHIFAAFEEKTIGCFPVNELWAK